jgi:hypothetical protein
MTNEAEVPAPTITGRPASFGTATFTINAAETQMTMLAEIHNIDVTGAQTPSITADDLRNAHIHASATVLPTTTAGVVWGFLPPVAPWTGSPFNDNNPQDIVVTPFATGVGGTFSSKWDAPEGNSTTFAAQKANLFGFRAYINFHTVGNGPGEIRAMIPEPSSAAVVLAGAFAAFARRRRAA